MSIKFVPMDVSYVDHMGSDTNVVNAARVSFAKEVSSFDDDKDTKLINYLAKHNHWSPLAHTSITLRIKAPIFLARQFVKHCVGGVWNEESRRYVDFEPEFYLPSSWREKPENAKQGSGGNLKGQGYFDGVVEDISESCLNVYNKLLSNGVAPEQARMVLPQNTMTNWMWTGSVVFFARVCKLRMDSHAQKEAQELAEKIDDVVSVIYPVSWKALMEHYKV